MKCDAAMAMILSLLLAGGASHAAAAGNRPANGPSGASGPVATGSIQVDGKAARKISMAIGGSRRFRRHRAGAGRVRRGSNATQYTVRTSSGRYYKCQIIEPSRAGKFFSFGTAAGADALCTEFGGSNGNGTRSANAPGGNSSARPEPAAAVRDQRQGREEDFDGDRRNRSLHGDQAGRRGIFRWHEGHRIYGQDGWWKDHKCQVLEPSKLGKLVTVSEWSAVDALCTDFTKGSRGQGKTNQANCNALLRAAHKCD